MFEFIQLSSLEKVFPDYEKPNTEYTEISALKNERFSYQIAFTQTIDEFETAHKKVFAVKINSPLKKYITVRTVENVPSELTHYKHSCDSDYIKKAPGLFPDPLFPLNRNEIEVVPYFYHSIWITVDTNGEVKPGEYTIEVEFKCDCFTESKIMKVEIINALLPKQELIFTQWFYTDCIASVYNIPIFSEKHWKLIEEFVKNAVKNGINTIYTPVFTPPLDTEIGGERPTVQLVDITVINGNFEFDFSRLKRWIKMLKRCSVEYIEISHFFTQWGAAAAPKIIAVENGIQKRIFGWDTPAASSEYKEFLDLFLPKLTAVLKEEQIDEKCIFHVSDEPHGTEQLKSYSYAKAMIEKHLNGYKIMDALSSYEYYESGTVKNPIPCTDHIDPFLKNNVPDLWTYYCCAQNKDVCNRFFDMPSYRNRAIALQLYKFNIKGFLQWGYNFYYSQFSRETINPFMTTEAKCGFPSGDAFSVYPGKDGPIESLRICVFYDAISDLRAFKLLETYIGKDAVVKLIENETKTNITFKTYPKSAELLLKLREKVNREIKKYCLQRTAASK